MSERIITLTTDFGQADGYVGTMKGVILGIAPGTTIVDLSHEIAPQDIAAGAFVLARAYPYFPPATIHVAVIDPGVGSTRRPILLSTPRGLFVGPDNGLFSPVLAAEDAVETYHLDRPERWLPVVSTTFQGRDIFAPVAAHLAQGVPPAALGTPVPPAGLVRLLAPAPTVAGGEVRGQILYIDRFGNAITNIPAALLAGLGPAATLVVTAGGQEISGVQTTYAAGAPGALLALVGSAGLLEIAVRDGHAAHTLSCRVGDPVSCRAAPPG